MGGKIKETLTICLAISKDFAWKCRNITVVLTTVRTARKGKKDPVKYPEVANVTFHCFPQNNEKIQYVPGMSEHERRRRWIAACRLESLNVTRHTRICSKHFEGGLGPTKANPFLRYTIFLKISSEKKWNHARIRRGDDWRMLPQQAKFRRQANVATRRLKNVRIWWNSKKFIWKTMKVVQVRKP